MAFPIGPRQAAGDAPGETPAVAELVLAARDGDREAFSRLHALHAPMVHAIALSRAPHGAVEDIVQESFLTAFAQIAELREPAAFGAWLAAISRSKARDLRRRQPRVAPLPEDLAGTHDPEREGEARRVLEALGRLPEAYRETLLMRLVEGMTGPEIAQRTGLTPGSVRVNLHRGMKRLRAELSAEGRS